MTSAKPTILSFSCRRPEAKTMIFGLQDRVSIEIGKVADLVLFTPGNVKANATYPSLLQPSSGSDVVFS